MTRRRLIVFAAGDYADDGPRISAGIDAAIAELQSWWCVGEQAFSLEDAGPLHSRRDVEEAVHRSGLRELAADDLVVVYIAAHGRPGPFGRHYLELPDTPPGRELSHGYPTADIVTAILGSLAEHVLVLVHSCFAAELRTELTALAKDLDDSRRQANIRVLAFADYARRPRVGEFAEILARARDWLTHRAEFTGRWLTFEMFFDELRRAARLQPALEEPVWALLGEEFQRTHLCLPNPGYRPTPVPTSPSIESLAAEATDLHPWLDKASGRIDAADPGWYFTGRHPLSKALTRFLRSGSGLLLVTGVAGTGKSALIARVVTLSDPVFLADSRYTSLVEVLPAETLPPIGSVDAAVNARDAEVEDVAAQLIVALGGIPRTSASFAGLASVLREQLTDLIVAEGRTCTFVVDGVDEARMPTLLITDLLGPLLRSAAGRVRLIAGVRSSLGPDGASPTGGLVEQLRRSAGANVAELRTDGPGIDADIAHYVEALLDRAANPYSADPSARSEVARRIAERVTPSFLDARLSAAQVLARPAPVDDAWFRSLDKGTASLLRADLRDSATSDFPEEVLTAVIRATAFAEGAGVPRAEIWPAIVESVSPIPVPHPDEAISQVLSSRLAGYLTVASQDGRQVYRPAHALVADALLGQPGSEIHRRVAERLARLLPADPGAAPHSYLRRHLVEHVRRGQVLDDAHLPADFMPWEESGRVRVAVGMPLASDQRARALAAWARIEPFLGDADYQSRLLSYDLALERDAPGRALGLRVAWAQWYIGGNVLFHSATGITAMAVVAGPDGTAFVVTGHDDEDYSVRLWEPITGAPIGRPLAAHKSWVRSIAGFTGPSGEPRFATAGDDRRLWIWDPTTGTAVNGPVKLASGTRALCAYPGAGGRTILAAGGWDEATVELIDPSTGEINRRITDLGGHITALGVSTEDGRPRLLVGVDVGGYKAVIKVFDPEIDEPLRQFQIKKGEPVALLEGRTRKGRPTVIAADSFVYGIQRWDAATGEWLKPKVLLPGVNCVTAFTRSDGRALLATGDEERTVSVWDAEKVEVLRQYRGHTEEIVGIGTFTGSHGGLRLISGDDKGTARVWDPLSEPSEESGVVFREIHCAVAYQTGDGKPAICVIDEREDGFGLYRGDSATKQWRIGSVSSDDYASITACASPDGRLLLLVKNGKKVAILNEAANTEVAAQASSKAHGVQAACAFRHRKHLLVAGAEFDTIHVWDGQRGDRLTRPFRTSDEVDRVIVLPLPPGPILATASGKRIQLFDPLTGSAAAVLKVGEPVSDLTSIVVAGSVLLAASCLDGTVRLWEPQKAQPVRTFDAGIGRLLAIAAFPAPDGDPMLVAGSEDSGARFFHPATGRAAGDLATAAPVHFLDSWSGVLVLAGPSGTVILTTQVPAEKQPVKRRS